MTFGYDIQQREEEDYNRDDWTYKQMLREEAFDPELHYCEVHDTCVETGCPKCIEELQERHRNNPPVFHIAPEDEPPF